MSVHLIKTRVKEMNKTKLKERKRKEISYNPWPTGMLCPARADLFHLASDWTISSLI